MIRIYVLSMVVVHGSERSILHGIGYGKSFVALLGFEHVHICFLNMPCEYYSPIAGGAISTIIMESAKELLRAGHRITVLTATSADDYAVGEVAPIEVKRREDLSLLQRGLSKLKCSGRGF